MQLQQVWSVLLKHFCLPCSYYDGLGQGNLTHQTFIEEGKMEHPELKKEETESGDDSGRDDKDESKHEAKEASGNGDNDESSHGDESQGNEGEAIQDSSKQSSRPEKDPVSSDSQDSCKTEDSKEEQEGPSAGDS